MLIETQKSGSPFFQFPVVDKVRLMAFPAIDSLVGARQFIAGEVVIKPSLVEVHHIEITSVMIAMATRTVLPNGLPGAVVADTAIDPAFDLLVATEAFIIGDLLT